MKRLLIIEDDRELQGILRMALEEAGFEVHSAEDGARGLELSAELRPDLILLDLMLPMVPGLDVLKKLSFDPLLHRIPVIVMTAYGDPEGVLEKLVLSRGAKEFIDKPFPPKEIIALINKVLEPKVKAVGGGARSAPPERK